MSFLLPCPTCGPRPVEEYSAGGELTTRPVPGCDAHELGRALYMRRNVPGRSSSGGTTRSAAATGSRPSATRARTRCCGWAARAS